MTRIQSASSGEGSIMGDMPQTGHDGAGWYEIRLQGHLDPRWSAWFDDMGLTNNSDGTTALRGHIADQAALHGLLQKVRDAGLPLVSLTPLDPDHPQTPSTSH
ncbi:hypothetical protein ACQCSX_06585 [Pseudarthrobacter sp. P1]|uniref:hypothetical protein n=1 Tax=Pseudarthrobacter sp. P1 TaxID=3418418 RepID=UPI003CF488EE